MHPCTFSSFVPPQPPTAGFACHPHTHPHLRAAPPATPVLTHPPFACRAACVPFAQVVPAVRPEDMSNNADMIKKFNEDPLIFKVRHQGRQERREQVVWSPAPGGVVGEGEGEQRPWLAGRQAGGQAGWLQFSVLRGRVVD